MTINLGYFFLFSNVIFVSLLVIIVYRYIFWNQMMKVLKTRFNAGGRIQKHSLLLEYQEKLEKKMLPF